jgi:hypothetical protein
MKTSLDELKAVEMELVELTGAYKGMAPEARKVLLSVARRYLEQFPARRPVRLRLVSNRNDCE